ncbi:NADP-dependent oxidoreductase [Streptomyces sp. NPDC046931]|uniref:NADP-dependent oxidoreductase n=1 Tax=Streptomyces sp. NPDC046931 TaxID=3154806 RepID=UPI0033E44938
MPKAYAYTRYGGPDTETFVHVDGPSPGPGQILAAVRAAGVNPVDGKLRRSMRGPGDTGEPEFPIVLGNEATGVGEEVGEGVTGFAAGDAVFGNTVAGGYAEYAPLPAAGSARLPQKLSFTDAAVLPVAAATAYDGIRRLGLPAGATLLVTGAGGGAGVAAVRIARAFGLRVIGTASEGKKEFVEQLGAVHVAPGAELAARVRAVAPEGVDGVYDLVGGEALQEAATLLTDRSKLLSAGAPREIERLGGARVARARTAAVLDEVARLVVHGDLDPHVGRTFPSERAGEALRAVEEGHVRGKLVIEAGA